MRLVVGAALAMANGLRIYLVYRNFAMAMVIAASISCNHCDCKTGGLHSADPSKAAAHGSCNYGISAHYYNCRYLFHCHLFSDCNVGISFVAGSVK